jgi:hypothetical protein
MSLPEQAPEHKPARHLADLPEPRRRAALALLEYLQAGRTIDLTIELDAPAYGHMADLGYGELSAQRASMDLLATGNSEVIPSVPPVVRTAIRRAQR